MYTNLKEVSVSTRTAFHSQVQKNSPYGFSTMNTVFALIKELLSCSLFLFMKSMISSAAEYILNEFHIATHSSTQIITLLDNAQTPKEDELSQGVFEISPFILPFNKYFFSQNTLPFWQKSLLQKEYPA